MTAPSLLSASPAARGEADSSRILAALEGRAPEAEVKHLATPRSSRARRWTALALLLALMAGGIAGVIQEEGAVPMVAQAPATVPGAAAPAAAPAPGPTRQAAELREQPGNTTRAAKSATPPRKSAKSADTDAALLSALMSYGLPPASPPGTRVYKSEGVFMREMPGSPLSERLKECRKLGFIESEQCRLRVCAGQWGTAVECPTPQANIEP